MRWTTLGASGFVGSHLARMLRAGGEEVLTPRRDELGDGLAGLPAKLGHLVYCIGLTADFRTRPLETMQAHVCVLRQVIERGGYDSLTYLSSTRVYAGSPDTDEEAALRVEPANPDSLYNLSKLAGESLCLGSRPDTAHRVVRLSNVYGVNPRSDNFLDSVLQSAAKDGRVLLRTAPASAKDYVSVEEAAKAIALIARQGRQRLYNVASGRNTSHEDIALALREQGVRVDFQAGAPTVGFPEIRVKRLVSEFGPMLDDVRLSLGAQLDTYRRLSGHFASEDTP